MANRNYLIPENVRCLEQGMDVIRPLEKSVFTNNANPYFSSGISRHFRHILDFYCCFTAGVNSRIDYDARERSPDIENDQQSALRRAKKCIQELKALGSDTNEVLVRSSGPADTTTQNDPGDCWIHSSVDRELLYLFNHTVHHFAIIAIILRIQGFQPDPEFGVAPSTLRYQDAQAQ